MTVLFNNPGVAFDPYSVGDIYYDAQKKWAFGTYVDRNNETATPRNVRISVPATALADFKASAAWSWFNNNSFVID